MIANLPQPMPFAGRPASMRRVALLSSGLLLASTLALLPVNTVLACSCMELTDKEAMAASDAAFIGVVVETRDPAAGNPIFSSADPIHYTVVVEESLKGDLVTGQEVTVSSARHGASCGQELAVGERWRLLAGAEGAAFTTGLCSGNQRLASGVAVPDRPSGGDVSIAPLITILGVGATGLLTLLLAVLFRRWSGRSAI